MCLCVSCPFTQPFVAGTDERKPRALLQDDDGTTRIGRSISSDRERNKPELRSDVEEASSGGEKHSLLKSSELRRLDSVFFAVGCMF